VVSFKIIKGYRANKKNIFKHSCKKVSYINYIELGHCINEEITYINSKCDIKIENITINVI